MISAAKARMKALCAINDNIHVPLRIIEEQIKAAVEQGLFDIRFYQYPLSPEIVSILREYGYTVEILSDYNICVSWDAKNGEDEM